MLPRFVAAISTRYSSNSAALSAFQAERTVLRHNGVKVILNSFWGNILRIIHHIEGRQFIAVL